MNKQFKRGLKSHLEKDQNTQGNWEKKYSFDSVPTNQMIGQLIEAKEDRAIMKKTKKLYPVGDMAIV